VVGGALSVGSPAGAGLLGFAVVSGEFEPGAPELAPADGFIGLPLFSPLAGLIALPAPILPLAAPDAPDPIPPPVPPAAPPPPPAPLPAPCANALAVNVAIASDKVAPRRTIGSFFVIVEISFGVLMKKMEQIDCQLYAGGKSKWHAKEWITIEEPIIWKSVISNVKSRSISKSSDHTDSYYQHNQCGYPSDDFLRSG
jgi:hypothetical protein